MGEGSARNTGLDAAGGKYVFHLDADDMLPEFALEHLYSHAKEYRSDMVKGAMAEVHDGEVGDRIDWSSPAEVMVNTNLHNSALLRLIPTSHCNYLYRRDFLNRNEIRYRTDLVVGLDLVALATALLIAKTVTLIPEIVYYYRIVSDSAVRRSLSVEVPLDAIRTQGIISKMLAARGFELAARERLQRWTYDFNTYWLRMPSELTRQESFQVFEQLRVLVSEIVPPWTPLASHQMRVLMTLVVNQQYEEALDFLDSEDAAEGFSDDETLEEQIEYVRETYPEDIGCLIAKGDLAVRAGDHETALRHFKKACEVMPTNIDALSRAADCALVLKKFEIAAEYAGSGVRSVASPSTLPRLASQLDRLASVYQARNEDDRTAVEHRSQELREKLGQSANALVRAESRIGELESELRDSKEALRDSKEALRDSKEALRDSKEALRAASQEKVLAEQAVAVERRISFDLKENLKELEVDKRLAHESADRERAAREVREEEVSNLESELWRLRQSLSWRITRPLRGFRSLLSKRGAFSER